MIGRMFISQHSSVLKYLTFGELTEISREDLRNTKGFIYAGWHYIFARHVIEGVNEKRKMNYTKRKAR